MRIVTLNANGIRAAARKGVFNWLPRQSADVVCLQEVRAQVEQLTDRCYFPRNWHCLYESGQRKGYAGVALYSRREPDEVIRGFGVDEFDAEGRYIEARFGNSAWCHCTYRRVRPTRRGRHQNTVSWTPSSLTWSSFGTPAATT